MTKMRKRPSLIKKFRELSLVAKIVLVLLFFFFVFEAIVHIYPIFWVVNNSIKTSEEFLDSTTALTATWSFKNYLQSFDSFKVNGSIGFSTMLFNSLWITFLYLLVNVGSSVMLAYGLARFKFPGRKFLYGIIIFIQTIPLFGAGAADYKLKYDLGLVNNPALIWISWAMGFDYTCFILYGTFGGISKSYSEAAEIDGASQLQVLLNVILPQAFPTILALLVTNFAGQWNDYTRPQVYLTNYPNLAYGLYLFEDKANWEANAKGMYFASIVICAIPPVIIYTLSQNLIIKNISVGGIKG